MTQDELDDLLYQWGRYHGREGVLISETAHPLERAREFAPGKRARSVVARDGSSRREAMAATVNAGTRHLHLRRVPMDFIDHVPCAETRSTRTPGREWPVPPHLERVNRAALDLIKFSPLLGLCLQARYCQIAFDAARAQWVGKTLKDEYDTEMDVSTKRFRDELLKAKFWMHGKLSQ
ncbi:hypothetical protein ACFFGH_06550 [Lysobacter korlensis]|uniref:Uncharacterized protein n=1 Tax=Lysobacter korlensis TaxID=553636 RepID=A0ABV6RKJ8_9GAMM